MKKIAWALIIALLIQLMPVSDFVSSETGTGGSVVHAATTDSYFYGSGDSGFGLRAMLKDTDQTFYVVDGVYPFASRIDIGYCYSDTYATFTITDASIDGTAIPDGTLTIAKTNYGKVVSGNLAGYVSSFGSHTLVMTLQEDWAEDDKSGTDTVKDMTYTITYADGSDYNSETTSTNTQYVSANQVTGSISWWSYEFAVQKESAKLKKAVLVSEADGSEVLDFTDQIAENRVSINKKDARYDYSIRELVAAIAPGYTMNVYLYDLTLNMQLPAGTYDAVYTADDGSTITIKDALESLTIPMIKSVVDSSNYTYAQKDAVQTDQNSDYVSIFVYGLNINKNSVRPVFYNDNDEAITDEDVEAVETTDLGALFRLKKTSDDMTIDTTDHADADYTVNYKLICYGLSSDGEKSTDSSVIYDSYFEKYGTRSVSIKYTPVYYGRYDAASGKYLIYFGTDYAKVGTETSVTLYSSGTDSIGTLTGTVEEYQNQLTGQTEVRGVYDVPEDSMSTLRGQTVYKADVTYQPNNGDTVTYNAKFGEYSSYYGYRTSNSPNSANGGFFTNLTGVIEKINTQSNATDCMTELYLPYFIGGLMEVEYGTIYAITAEDEAKTDGLAFYEVPQTDSADKIATGQFSNLPTTILNNCNSAKILCSHANKEATETVAPTCSSRGYTTYICKRCKGTFRSDFTDRLSHTYVQQSSPAGIGTTGFYGSVCSVCGTFKGTDYVVIPAISTVSITSSSYNYSGKAIKPTVTVKDTAGKTLKPGTDYTVTYQSQCTLPGTCNMRVTFKGNYTGSTKLKYTIAIKGTSISKVTAASKAFKVTWKKQASQTSGYQIRYSTSSKMSGAKTVTIKKNSTTSATVKKLSAKKKYYVQVRTFKKIGSKTYYSAWSASKAVKTK